MTDTDGIPEKDGFSSALWRLRKHSSMELWDAVYVKLQELRKQQMQGGAFSVVAYLT
jgi:hypothetical protein